MAGSREHGRYGHTSGLDIDRLMSEFRANLPPAQEAEAVGSDPEAKPDRRRWKSREGTARRITRARAD
jgi:hypothetical protein